MGIYTNSHVVIMVSTKDPRENFNPVSTITMTKSDDR